MNPQSILLVVLILILFGALLIRPQSKRSGSVLTDGFRRVAKRVVSGGASARMQPRESADVVAATEPRFDATTTTIHELQRPGRFESSALHADVASPAHPMQPDSQPDIPPDDWDVLFGAVTARLRNAVDRRLAAAPEPQGREDAVGRLQVIVLECVGALDQLHAALANERGRQRQVEPTFCAPPVTR